MAAPASPVWKRESVHTHLGAPDDIDDILNSFYHGPESEVHESGLVIELSSDEEEDGEFYDLYGSDFEHDESDDSGFYTTNSFSMEELNAAMVKAFPEEVSESLDFDEIESDNEGDAPYSPTTPSPHNFDSYDHEKLKRLTGKYMSRSLQDKGLSMDLSSPTTPSPNNWGSYDHTKLMNATGFYLTQKIELHPMSGYAHDALPASPVTLASS